MAIHRILKATLWIFILFSILLFMLSPIAATSEEKNFTDNWIQPDTTRMILGGSSLAYSNADNPAIPSPALNEEKRSVILAAPWYTLDPIYTARKTYTFLDKRWAKWNVLKNGTQIGSLILIESTVHNGDYYYLIRYEPYESRPEPFSLQVWLENADQPFLERHTEYPQGIAFDKSVWMDAAPVKGNLPRYTAVVENGQYALWMSLSNVYRPMDKATLEERYEKTLPIRHLAVSRADNNENSRIFSHAKNAENTNATDSLFILSFPQQKGLIGEQWSVVSAFPLIDWNHQMAPVNLRMADLNRARKWSIAGPYYQVPSSYYPYTPTNFWRNHAHHIGELFIRIDGGRLFETFGLISLYNAVETQNNRGYWWTTPRSEWLYKDYGIDSTFYDTRFNTDAALFLVRGYRKFADPALLEAANKYAAFLVDFAAAKHFSTANGGILVFDYGHDHKPNTNTHVSLNHHVTEMNFLYEMYLLTENKTYLETAERMRQGVKDTVWGWRRADGDLHYAYLVNGKFGMQDYPTLTLNDLRYSQSLIHQITGANDPDFQRLIDWKVEFLNQS